MAHILIVELPGGNDTDIVQAALDRGDRFTFLTGDLAHYQQQPAVMAKLLLAEKFIEVRGFDETEVKSQVAALHTQDPISAILCLIETRLPEAARLAQMLGLRHVGLESAALLRDKFSVRCRLTERGIVQPEYELADSNETLKRAVDTLGLPVLIKPSDGYASQNIVVLQYPEDLDPLMTPLDDMLPCRADYGLGVRSNDRLLVERFMSGQIIGCDTLTFQGQHTLVGVHEKLFFSPPSFAIRGSSFLANGPQYSSIERYVGSVLDAVGFDWGATHIELMITEDGPRLIEINPRLVGAKIGRLVSYARGRSLHADLIALHAGESTSYIPPPGPALVAVTRWVVADREGILERVEFPQESNPRIRCIEMLKRPGDYVRPPIENADRIGYVMVCAPSRLEAEDIAERFVSQVQVKLKAVETPNWELEIAETCTK